MSTNNLAVRFTDDTYASRQQVARELGTNLIDSIWKQILEYRKAYVAQLSIFDVSKTPLSVTLTNKIVSNSRRIFEKIKASSENFADLKDKSIEKEVLSKDMFKSSLRYLAHFKEIIVNDIALENIVKGNNSDLLYEPLTRYFDAIKSISVREFNNIDENLIAQFLQILYGNNELLSFYRTKEIQIPSQKVLINREYVGSPVAVIESMMNATLNFINNENNDLVIRLAATLYMFNYIKPFERFNEEISILIVKCLLAKTTDKTFASILPIEALIFEEKDALNTASKDVQKTCDLTYYLIETMRLLDDVISSFNNRLIQLSRDSLEEEYFDKKPTLEKVEDVKEIKKEETPVAEKEVESVKEKITPHISNNKPAVNVHLFEELDEKSLNKAAQNLLESDPNLRASQAHFYVRHCTLGKYYTIQQYKKCERVVYETARTSMEYLARAGYYRREQVKNKFVYTPISKE